MVDWETALHNVGGNARMLSELIGVFLQDASTLMEEMARALSERDGTTLHRTAHTLKGMVNFFGATALADTALTLEKMGARSDFDTAQSNYNVLTTNVKRLQAELAARTS